MKFKLGIILSLLALSSIFFVLKKDKNEESIQKIIQFDFPHHQEWETPSLTPIQEEQLNRILSQKFTFLGKGARILSFLSEDGLYVLKFFKYRYHYPHWAVRYLPSIFPFEGYRQRKMQKVSLSTVLNGYNVAYEHDPQNTGLVYIHLNLTSNQLPHVRLIDKKGDQTLVDLNQTRFVIQLKVHELMDLLNILLKENKIDLAKRRICQVFDLYHLHYQNGLYDLGVGILANNGFIDEKPIHFDVSKMTFDERIYDPELQKERMMIMKKKISIWLHKNYPSYHDEIMQAINNKT